VYYKKKVVSFCRKGGPKKKPADVEPNSPIERGKKKKSNPAIGEKKVSGIVLVRN